VSARSSRARECAGHETGFVEDFSIGKVQAICGRASYNYVIKGIELALKGEIDAIVTNPISKEALKMAGINYPGHTEILAEKTGTKNFSMMFASENVHVVHVTTHVSLKNALTMITKEAVLSHTRLLQAALRDLGIKSPRIAFPALTRMRAKTASSATKKSCT
jgi:4-hydroxy-L-threonine phosphate dehydrogenase PdxA